MTTYNRELSNLSYTNKDFGQIYPELLDLAKKISYKWDPSLSDESDPGVVLLKLAALMADKCNYNIDKNILELFPASVTQLSNARQLFDQCGYTMRYYKSATTLLTFRMLAEPNITDSDVAELLLDDSIDANTLKSDRTGAYLRHYIVPKFTMFSDVDNSVVYTITEELDIKSDGNPESVNAIQGAITQYSVNGSTVITADMLDSNNRLYFTELNIPENGIFISNVDSTAYWEQADNLLVLPIGTRCYKFGLTLDGRKCYVEFPSDISTLIGKGLEIHYVLTAGREGNVGRHFIRQFFSDTDVKRRVASYSALQDVDLTTDNIYIINESAAQNGRNPESIEDAYRNYQKVKTTFNTLVSVRDYANFLKTDEDVSNCIVCDRSNDIQSTYSVLNNVDGVHQLIPRVRTKQVSRNGEFVLDDGTTKSGTFLTVDEEMTAFDLRIYGLKYVDGFADYKSFSKSFDVINFGREPSSIERNTADIKCLSHNYLPFERDRILLLKNRYPIVAKIVSPYKLALSQQDEIISRVKLNLFELLNSQVIEFGQEIDYNVVYDTILKSDPRISALILDELKYETYAVYYSSLTDTLELMRIDALSAPPSASNKDQQEFLTNLWNKFRTDVYARSVLAGNTQLFIPENTFVYSLAHERAENGDATYEVEQLSSAVRIPLTYNPENESLVSRVLKPNDVITLTSPNLIMDKRYANYCQFVTNIGIGRDGTRPQYSAAPEVVVKKNTDYVLDSHEYIVFFWRTTDSDTEPYSYVKYTGRDSNVPVIINPSFDIVKQPCTANISGVSYTIDDELFMTLGDQTTSTGEVKFVEQELLTVDSFAMYTGIPSDDVTEKLSLNNFINRYLVGGKFNVGSNSIETKVVNKIHLNNSTDGTDKFYWILNDTVEDSDGNSFYRLFSADSSDNTYILKDGEQLVYSNSKLTQLYVLGAGTKIQRNNTSETATYTAWDCPALDHKLEFLQVGPQYFEDPKHSWFNMTVKASKFDLYATEMMYRKLSANTQLTIQLTGGNKLTEQQKQCQYYITSNGIEYSDGKTDAEFHLSKCSFTFVNEVGNHEELPDRLHHALQWTCTSSLNLNMSYDKPQRLYSNQTIKWMPLHENIWYELEGSDIEERYIQSDRSLTRTGGSCIDVRYFDVLSEKYIPLSIYLYKLKDLDLSSSVEINNYDIPWMFSSSGITVSSHDVSLSNVTLPEGNYILPVDMRQINNPINVYWTELRKLSKYRLNSAEKKIIQGILPVSDTDEDETDWDVARKPVELHDVARWIYGSAYVDVATEFKNCTVLDGFNSLFVKSTSDATKYSRRPTTDVEYDSALGSMLAGYGGSSLAQNKEFVSFETGDIVCIERASSQSDEVPTYQVWVYSPSSDETDRYPFIRTEFGPQTKSTCERESQTSLAESQADCFYYYVLRPSNVTTKIVEGVTPESICSTVTGITPCKNMTYYFLIHSDGSDVSYTLRLTEQRAESNISDVSPLYEIKNPIKYSKPTISQSSREELPIFDSVVAAIADLDVDSRFDFTYNVPDSKLVMYPLDSTAFLDPNHPMNKFTICQYVISESKLRNDLVVVSKSR